MIPTKLKMEKIQSKLFYIITFCMAVVLVSLVMLHPTEVKAEDLSVGVITVNYQNTEYGSCSSDKAKVSLVHASNFKYNFQCVKNGKTSTYTICWSFTGTKPIYLIKYCGDFGSGIYKRVACVSSAPVTQHCYVYDSTGLVIYNDEGTESYNRGNSSQPFYSCGVMFAGNSSSEYFTDATTRWSTLGLMYDHIGGISWSCTKDQSSKIDNFKTIMYGDNEVIEPPTDLLDDFSNTSDKDYDTDLGYIHDFKVREIEQKNGSEKVEDFIYYTKYSWDSEKSTSGFIYTDSSYIQVQSCLITQWYKYLLTGKHIESTDWKSYKMVSAKDGVLKVTYDEEKAFWGEEYAAFQKINSLGKYFKFNYRFRICVKTDDGWKYGNWFECSSKDPTSADKVNNTDPDGNPTDDNPDASNGSYPDSGFGSGDTPDEAEDNADGNSSTGNPGDNMVSNLKNLFTQVGQIPALISDLFSFLPPWCLAFIAFGFTVFVFFMIVKAIRG